MAKSLDAVLAAARGRIAGANPAGRNTGSPEATTTGSDPGVDYASKSSGDRAFVAKHTHIEQEYPNGMKHAFTGDPVDYALPKTPRMGNTEKEAEAAYEEISQFEYDMLSEEEQALYELSKKTLNSYAIKSKVSQSRNMNIYAPKHPKHDARQKGQITAHTKLAGKAKVNASEETIVEISKGSLRKFKRGMAAALNDKEDEKKPAVKEEVEQIDEISKKLAARYLDKNADSYNKTAASGDRTKARNRGNGASLATKKLTGRAKVNAEEFISDEPEMDVLEGILCDKTSLGKKMKYHKGKMSNEDIGSVKFRHHQKQIHIIKTMMEEIELDEKKEEGDNLEYKLNKRGFLEKKRKYEKKKDTKEEVDPQVARIVDAISKENF